MTLDQFDIIFLPPDSELLTFARIFFIMFTAGTAVFIVYVWATTPFIKKAFWWDMKEFFTFNAYSVRKINKDWNKIIRRVKTNMESEFKMAIIEADLLLDRVLAGLGYMGKNLQEKLEQLKPGVLSDIEAVKAADQVYRNLVFGEGQRLNYDQTKQVILAFKQALDDVKAF